MQLKKLSTLALVVALVFVGACGGEQAAATPSQEPAAGDGNTTPPMKTQEAGARTVQLSIDGMA